MEGWSQEIVNMIFEMQEQNAQQKANVQKMGKADKYGFPFEPYDSFSTEPLGFMETAMRLETESAKVFHFMREVNRHSPLYYSMSSQLEKLLKELGSICLTKAILEQQGQEFPLLEGLTIERLREQTAFNYRKCYSSFMESMTGWRCNSSALSLSLRWAILDKRLLATAEKIEQVKAGKVRIDLKNPSALPQQNADTAKEASQEQEAEDTAPALAPKHRAFSPDKGTLRTMLPAESGSPAGEAPTDEPVPGEAASLVLPDATAQDETSSETTLTPQEQTDPVPDAANESAAQDEPELPDLSISDEDYERFCRDDYYDEEENLPCVSEEMVRRMSALWNDPDLISWAIRQTAAAP